jgi:hypothetical protein
MPKKNRDWSDPILRYVMTWEQQHTIKIGEYHVPLPDQPPLEYMINYGKKEKDQFFEYTLVPKDLKQWTARERDEWVDNEYHRRKHGVWMLIRGVPVYITGLHYIYLNYWTPGRGKKIIFKFHDCLFFYFWDMCVKDPLCMGTVIFKPRRIGDTEKSNFIAWEFASRVRRARCGMQNLENKRSKQDFLQLVQAHKAIPFFLRPVGYRAENKLVFNKPDKKLKEEDIDEMYGFFSDDEEENMLQSVIDHEDTVLGKYDGTYLNRYRMGEFGKWVRVSAYEQWEKVKLCFIDPVTRDIIGKAILESSVENNRSSKEVATVSSLETAKKLWDDSNPNERMNSGQTKSGLYRLFRGYDICGKSDEYGFPLVEENKNFVMNTLFELREDQKAQLEFRLKHPIDVTDCFMTDEGQNVFDQIKIGKLQYQKRAELDYANIPRDDDDAFKYPIEQKGDLIWENGIRDSKVVFVPNENGNFVITQHPTKENALFYASNGKKAPANFQYYRIGIDPVDHSKVEGAAERKSKGSGVVFKMFNQIEEENAGNYDEDGKLHIPRMKSHQWVCSYVDNKRTDNPEDFFEDMVKMCVYYGAPMLFESQKNSIKGHFLRRGYGNYMMYPPKEVGTKVKKDFGAPSTEHTIDQYITKLLIYFSDHYHCIHHSDIIEDFRTFQNTTASRRVHDLTVACGFSLLATLKSYGSITEETERAMRGLEGHTFHKTHIRTYVVR